MIQAAITILLAHNLHKTEIKIHLKEPKIPFQMLGNRLIFLMMIYHSKREKELSFSFFTNLESELYLHRLVNKRKEKRTYGFYERIFGELQPNSDDEATVHCPWHEDSEASAHINIESRVFHCKACDLGLSETAFVQKHMGCGYGEALQYTKLFERTLTSDEKWTENMMNLMEDSKCQERLRS